jgi:DNA mismatch repair protein MutS
MTFHSILFEDGDAGETEPTAPSSFIDLNLDQVVDAITSSEDPYKLKPFFYRPLRSANAIHYRHEVLRDLENPTVFAQTKTFSQAMREMRQCRAQADQLRNELQKQRWVLDAAFIYCHAVVGLAKFFDRAHLQSRGLRGFRQYLTDYAESPCFRSLAERTAALRSKLTEITYTVLIKDSTLTVRRYDGEPDYLAEIESAFERFREGAAKDRRVRFHEWPHMNHVEEKILEFVARLYPEVFRELHEHCGACGDFTDEKITAFDREIQFYVAYLEYISKFTRKGLKFCYPAISETDKNVDAHDTFDIALAGKLLKEESAVVCNEFSLREPERMLVVTGPNQGGKTTFARTFGQVHYLAALGCPVPGRDARLFLFDNLFTHFEKEEDLGTFRGSLEDSLVRIHQILRNATSRSIVIMNEMFASTTAQDALLLSSRILQEISELDALAVCVTFLDELASLNRKTVSMVAGVVPENPMLRTYKILRRMPDGKAWALSIAEKHGLTYKAICDRIKP